MLNGMLIINKPRGITSHDVVAEVRRILHTRRVGHTGTLDPEATGVLPVCVGPATKIAQFFLSSDKEYAATMTLGVRTDTQDAAGKIIYTVEKLDFGEKEVKSAFSHFVGEIEQIPPMVSAVRHKGKKLYELARQGKEVEREPRRVKILELEILSCEIPQVSFRVSCSKGTYIRTLTSDIGDKLGCGAHQSKLTRLRSGPFRLSDAITLKELREMPHPESRIIPVKKALSHLPAIEVRDWFGKFVSKNAPVSSADIAESPRLHSGEFVRINNSRGDLLAIGEVQTVAEEKAATVKVLRPLVK